MMEVINPCTGQDFHQKVLEEGYVSSKDYANLKEQYLELRKTSNDYIEELEIRIGTYENILRKLMQSMEKDISTIKFFGIK